jgi:hypothetical protein
MGKSGMSFTMIEVLLNELSLDGMRRVKVISDHAVREADLRSLVPGASQDFAVVSCQSTAALNVFYGEVTWPCREVIECRVACVDERARRFAVWKMMPGERMSEVIVCVAEWYFVQTRQRPQFAFVRRMPKGAISGQRLAFSGQLLAVDEECEDDGVMLFEAEWALNGCVMIGG